MLQLRGIECCMDKVCKAASDRIAFWLYATAHPLRLDGGRDISEQHLLYETTEQPRVWIAYNCDSWYLSNPIITVYPHEIGWNLLAAS
mmetsp:Transcript_6261/g.12358  ORF Transcript_6261/g.12358 Transcript_6261/m.12358 type:complete len:88 (+) Transcript_6261:240-503(+)|eukprot:2265454-Pleurochrysis_carterae.AAC.3